MVIVLNGERKTVRDNTSILQLVQEMELGKKRYAVEVNDEIVPKSEHGNAIVLAGDKVEVVVAIGGG